MIKNQNKFLYCLNKFSVNFIANNKVYYGLKSDFNQEISFSYHTTKIFLIPGQYENIYADRLSLVYYIDNYPKRYICFNQSNISFDLIKEIVKQIILKYKKYENST